jgi:hypothetical protein
MQAFPGIARGLQRRHREGRTTDGSSHVIAGMQDHLQTIHDVIDNVEGYAEDILGLIPPRPLKSPKKQTKVVNE